MEDLSLDKKIDLAIKRIEHILKYESDTITSVYSSGDGTVVIELESGNNLELTTREMEHRAEEEFENMKECGCVLTRDEVVDEITHNYVNSMHQDMNQGDFSFAYSFVRGEGAMQINKMTNEELVVEYKEVFGKDIIIND